MEFGLIGLLILMMEPTLGPGYLASGPMRGDLSRPAALMGGWRIHVALPGNDGVRLRWDLASWRTLDPATGDPRGRTLRFESVAVDYLWGSGRKGWYRGLGLDRTTWTRVDHGTEVGPSGTFTVERPLQSRTGPGGTALAGCTVPLGQDLSRVWLFEGRCTVSRGLDGGTTAVAALSVGFRWRPW